MGKVCTQANSEHRSLGTLLTADICQARGGSQLGQISTPQSRIKRPSALPPVAVQSPTLSVSGVCAAARLDSRSLGNNHKVDAAKGKWSGRRHHQSPPSGVALGFALSIASGPRPATGGSGQGGCVPGCASCDSTSPFKAHGATCPGRGATCLAAKSAKSCMPRRILFSNRQTKEYPRRELPLAPFP